MIIISPPQLGQSAICGNILRALPEWFGIEEATRHYIEFANTHPTWVAYNGDDAVGFLTVKRHFPASTEIYVMGVLPAYHRQGIGRALVEAVQDHLRADGVRYLQVKTLGTKHPDISYQKTRAFYMALGFLPLEEFDNL